MPGQMEGRIDLILQDPSSYHRGPIKKFFYNFICSIINHDFYVITLLLQHVLHHYLWKKWSHLLLLIEFSTCQIFWDILWCYLNMVLFYWDILQLTVLYFYHYYFDIQYNFYSKTYLLLLVYNIFLILHAQKDS